MSFDNKVVMVTGGSRGIGRAVVLEFVKRGARVYFSYNRSIDAAQSLSAESGATGIQCSQTDGDAIDEAVGSVLAEAGSIDILVNNAGITSDQFLMMMPFEQWQQVLDTNLSGAWRWLKAVCRPMLRAGGGAVVNVSSVAGIVGVAGQTNYAASKGGLIAFTRALAAEFAPRGIRVNVVVPGFVDTDMTAKMPRDVKRASRERILLKRFADPLEIAKVVCFLASEDASYIIGQSIVVDGGLTSGVA